jgi:hypothetical protein
MTSQQPTGDKRARCVHAPSSTHPASTSTHPMRAHFIPILPTLPILLHAHLPSLHPTPTLRARLRRCGGCGQRLITRSFCGACGRTNPWK